MKFLKLEILSKRGAYVLFFLNWLAVIFAFVFGLFEYVASPRRSRLIERISLKLLLNSFSRRRTDLRIRANAYTGVQMTETKFEFQLDDVSPMNRFLYVNVALENVAQGRLLNATVLGLLPDADRFELLLNATVASTNETLSMVVIFDCTPISISVFCVVTDDVDVSQCQIGVRPTSPLLLNTTVCSVAPIYDSNRIAYRAYRFSIDLARNDSELVTNERVRFVVATHKYDCCVRSFTLC
jgi:hypothetical protein